MYNNPSVARQHLPYIAPRYRGGKSNHADGNLFSPMCFTHVKYRGSGCKPRGLEDVTVR